MKIKLLLATLILFAGTTQATTVLYQDFDQLVDSTQHVVTGAVVNVKARRANREIFTTVVLTKAKRITAAGEEPLRKRVQLRFKGGTLPLKDKEKNIIGEETLQTLGSPEFEIGDEVVVFVNWNGTSDMPFNGFSQGVFKVSKNSEMLDAGKSPIVGMQGADLITLNEHGLMVRGQHVNAQSVVAGSSEGVELLSSDGGADEIVLPEYAGPESGVDSTNGVAYSPLSYTQFLSMVQERMADQAFVASVETSVDSLINLPNIDTSQSLHSDEFGNVPTTLSAQLVQSSEVLSEPLARPPEEEVSDE